MSRPAPAPSGLYAEVEAAGVGLVIQALAAEDIAVSVDTMCATTAAAAVAAGATIVNECSGGLADPDMDRVVAEANQDRAVDYCLMHWRAERFESAAGRADHTGGGTRDVTGHLVDLADRAQRAGVPGDRIILDPGLGFAKDPATTDPCCAASATSPALGHRVLVGASRKRFLTALRPGSRRGTRCRRFRGRRPGDRRSHRTGRSVRSVGGPGA